MKNVLFATTALIATAGVAFAAPTVGGSAFMGIVYDGTDIDVAQRMRITFAGSVETDSGIAFGASSRITEANGSNSGMLEHTRVTMASGGLTLAVGATHGAMRNLARVASFQGFNGGGVIAFDTGHAGVTGLTDGGNNVYLSYAMGDLVVGLASDVAGNEQDIAVRYTVNSFTIGAGANTNDGWMVSGSMDLGNVSASIGYNSADTAVLSVGYAISDATGLQFDVQNAAAGTSYGVSVSQDLGGASLQGTLGQTAAGTTLAGLGVSFSF